MCRKSKWLTQKIESSRRKAGPIAARPPHNFAGRLKLNGITRVAGGLTLGIALAAGPALAYQRKSPDRPVMPFDHQKRPEKPNPANEEDKLIKLIGPYLVASQRAVTCQIRTQAWRLDVSTGLTVVVGVAFLEEDQWEQKRHIGKILRAAETQAALATKGDAPNPEQCDQLKESNRLKMLDATASIVMSAGAVKDDQ
jgi:hypothetical protein